MRESILSKKSFEFAVRIVNLRKYLNDKVKEYELASQLLRSGTSIGANISEANYAQSNADFITKLQIALKEAAEAEYWIRLLTASEYLSSEQSSSLLEECLAIKKC